ncbi:MAG: ribonuclease HI [Weeksellaceae bacterium]|nr:ribonuclease HI [Weeksellaceae bacterium]
MAIIAYTDGSSLGNPGPGGYAVVLFDTEKKVKRELTEGFRNTTNNRMELLAVIVALERLKKKPTEITIYTDSKYVHDAVEKKWVFGWEKKGFRGKKNPDLWMRFLRIYRQHKVRLQWVKGHAGNPMNERADELAVAAANNVSGLKVDEGYEQQNQTDDLFSES